MKFLLQIFLFSILLNFSGTYFTASLETISKLSNKYEKLVLMAFFNMTTRNPNLSQYFNTFALSLLNTDPFFLEFKTPSCEALWLTNFKSSFMKANVK